MALDEFRFHCADAAVSALCAALAQNLREAIEQRAGATLAVSGGRSPVPLFEALSRTDLDWSRVTVTLVDERWVDPGSPDSNENLVRRHLLQHFAAAARLLPLRTAAAHPRDAVSERSAALAPLLPLDAVVLGMGEDGHTASLFPGAQGLEAALDLRNPAPLAAINPPAAPHARMSLTLAGLLQSRRLFLPLGGAKKLGVYAEARATRDVLALPVAAVLQQQRVPVDVYRHP